MSVANNDPSLNSVNINGFIMDVNTYELMKGTLYPNAKDSSIVMVMRYCIARKLDPIKKPVHIVPMNVKTGKKDIKGKDIYEMRDTVMPGIGLYRIDADRTGEYAGMSEPEFGDEVTETIGKVTVTYPKWCKITVYRRLPTGEIVSFPAKEFWKENYARNKWTGEPTDVWQTRSYGQLAKCTEAQALRKGFPEAVGNEYTKEEMEGKGIGFENASNSGHVTLPANNIDPSLAIEQKPDINVSVDDMVLEMSQAATLDELQEIYTKHYKSCAQARDMDAMKQVIAAKDKVKHEMQRNVLDEDAKEFVEEMDKE